MEPQDVLADQVIVDRPPLREPFGVRCVTHRGAVVEQRVGPDIGDVFRIPGQRHPPRDRRATHREVLQATANEAEHLVAARVGLHRVGMCGVVLEEAVLVARQLEEVVLFGDVLHRPVVDRTVARY